MKITNEMMFYGGIILAAVSGTVLVIYLLTARMRRFRLDAQLDQEYGKTEKNRKCQK